MPGALPARTNVEDSTKHDTNIHQQREPQQKYRIGTGSKAKGKTSLVISFCSGRPI